VQASRAVSAAAGRKYPGAAPASDPSTTIVANRTRPAWTFFICTILIVIDRSVAPYSLKAGASRGADCVLVKKFPALWFAADEGFRAADFARAGGPPIG